MDVVITMSVVRIRQPGLISIDGLMVKFPLAKREPRVRFPVDASAITPASQSAVVIPYLIAKLLTRFSSVEVAQDCKSWCRRFDPCNRDTINPLLEKVEQNFASFGSYYFSPLFLKVD